MAGSARAHVATPPLVEHLARDKQFKVFVKGAGLLYYAGKKHGFGGVNLRLYSI
jgi:hypothetical protein